MKHIIRLAVSVALFYCLVHVSPAFALLAMVTVACLPFVRLSYEIAVTEDRRTNAESRQQYQMQREVPYMQRTVYLEREEAQRTRILEAQL